MGREDIRSDGTEEAGNGWWLGVAELPGMEPMMRSHRLPNGKDRDFVVATSIALTATYSGETR